MFGKLMLPAPIPALWRAWRVSSWLLTVTFVCVWLVLNIELVRVVLLANTHTVVPRKVYRSAQLSPQALEQFVREHGIRTVVNLRGCCDPLDWYRDECRVSQQLGISHEDVSFSAYRFPPKHEVRDLLAILDRAEHPILLHCRRGSDRTGVAAAMVRLLEPSGSLDHARRQLHPRFGHIPFGGTARLDDFLQRYVVWLEEEGKEHKPQHFRHWLTSVYDGVRSARVDAFICNGKAGQPFQGTVRLRNTGGDEWRFRPGKTAGVVFRYSLRNNDERVVAEGYAGLFRATVKPGETIELTLAFPALPPGHYHLFGDLAQPGECMFYQTGSEPLDEELKIGG